MNLLQAMRDRRSVRTFADKPVDDALLARLLAEFDACERIGDLTIGLLPMPAAAVGHAMTGIVGSYGAIHGAPLWIIGLAETASTDQVELGYAMEQFILFGTREGLGTCWIGGFFKKSALEAAVPVPDGMRIVCITPLGYAAPRRLAERAMRAAGGLNRRKPLSERVFDGAWGTPATDRLAADPQLAEVFELARWAPSASNQQPVHYVLDGERIVCCLDTSLQRNYPGAIADDRAEFLRFQGVDAGIGMAHVRLACRELGRGGSWSVTLDESALTGRLALPDSARVVGVYAFD